MPAWTNGSGRQMPDSYLSDGWRSNLESWGYDLVTLNHYAVRSLESFLVKSARGDAVVEGRIDTTYFRRRNQIGADTPAMELSAGMRFWILMVMAICSLLFRIVFAKHFAHILTTL